MAGHINEKFFYDQIRSTLFDGSISAKQISGLSTILSEWSSKHAGLDDRYLAYMLATTHHETGRTMQPIKEWGADRYFFSRYDKDGGNPALAKRLGNIQAGDGVRFCGRGFVQLTGRSNYANWAQKTGRDLTGHPELALDVVVATQILVEGMIAGSFTGKKLGDYFGPGKADWSNARRIINGTDKAQLIASYGLKYYAAISYTV